MGLGNSLFIIFFFIIGLIIGIKFKIVSSSIIFLFIYFGSLFGKGQGTVLSVLIFFIFGILLAINVKKFFSKNSLNFLF